ncbi:MAG: hypothetical protein E7082_00050 [Bacteroidales bacterium]|nr:hypothetical protein [Bacteroidales bacterium]
MIVNYSFSSFPQRSVIITATDGDRQISVTEPIGEMSAPQWSAFEQAGYASPEQFITDWNSLLQKLRHTEQLLAATLRSIQRTHSAIDSGQGIIAYGRALIASLKADPANASRTRKYSATLTTFAGHLRTLGLTDINLADLSAAHIDQFTAALRAGGRKEATVSFYCRILQAIYNTAVRTGLINSTSPFANAPTNANHLPQ